MKFASLAAGMALTSAASACGVLSSDSSSSPSSDLLVNVYGPGQSLADRALVGTRFPVSVVSLGFPGGNCGGGPCPPASATMIPLDASCDDGACTAVVDGQINQVATFEVMPLVAGPTTLHVHVRGASSGMELRGVTSLTFVSSAHVEVHADDQQLSPIVNRVKYAALVGDSFRWQVTLDGDEGERLAADPSAFQISLDGPGYGLGTAANTDASYVTLVANAVGTTKVHLAVGSTARDLSLWVVDPSDVMAAEFHELPVPTSISDETLEEPDLFSENASPSLTTSWTNDQSMWAVLLMTKSGTPAMGGASQLSMSPDNVATVYNTNGGTLDDGIMTVQPIVTHSATGTVAGQIGNIKVSIPLTFTN